jgi:hypothetical protein
LKIIKNPLLWGGDKNLISTIFKDILDGENFYSRKEALIIAGVKQYDHVRPRSA